MGGRGEGGEGGGEGEGGEEGREEGEENSMVITAPQSKWQWHGHGAL